MAIDSKTRQKLEEILDGTDYRIIVSGRASVHPNTVANVLKNGTDNPTVELELLQYAQEIKGDKLAEEEKRKKARAIAKQL